MLCMQQSLLLIGCATGWTGDFEVIFLTILPLQSVCLSRDELLVQLTSAYLHTSSLTLLNLIAAQSWILSSARDQIIVVHAFAARTFVICFISTQGGQCPSPRDRHIELDFRHSYNSGPPVLSRPCLHTPQ